MVSRTAEYALRIMVVLQRHAGGGYTLARDIAAESGVPAPYVSTILHRLRHAGLVAGERGLGGGYSLKVPAAKIKVYDIITVFDDVEGHRRCVLGHQVCNVTEGCPVHDMWSDILCTYNRFLHEMTLEKLAAARRISGPSRPRSGQTPKKPRSATPRKRKLSG